MGIRIAPPKDEMAELKAEDYVSIALGGILAVLATLSFASFFHILYQNWIHNEQFSYGLLIPPIAAFLIWKRKDKLNTAFLSWWTPGFLVAGIGCGLQILASRSGTLLLSGIAFVAMLVGITAFLWGLGILKICAGPLALLILMVPLPSYAVGQVTWYLQSMASTVSANILERLGVPVFQDGNLLRLPNYVLEVKQACSGSNSILSLIALALVIGLHREEKCWKRVILVLVAPVLAIAANVIRIVGTGLIARQWGNLAANESLHTGWGVAVFLLGVLGLLGIHNLLRKKECELV
jgi:exosortase